MSAPDPLAELWTESEEILRGQIEVLADAALAALEAPLAPDRREQAMREAHKLAGSLGSFGLMEGTKLARDAEWLLRGAARVEGDDALRLSQLVAGIEREFASGPRLGSVTAEQAEPTVLIVEPDVEVARRVVEASTALGLRPAVAHSAADARGHLAHGPPDLVLLDPAGDPALLHDVCQAVDPACVVVATTPGGAVDRSVAARAGVAAFVEKPARPQALAEVTLTTMERRHATFRVLAVNEVAGLAEALRPLGGELEVIAADEPLWPRLGAYRPDLLLLATAPAQSQLACRMVRTDPAWERLPVACLAAPEAVRAAYRAGVDDAILDTADGAEVAERVADRIARSRTRREAGEDDPQTGLVSWPQAERELQRQLALSRRYGQPMALVALAVDEQPELRAAGPGAREVATATLARVLRPGLRVEDTAGRRGDTIAVGLYGVEPQGALTRIDALLEAFHATSVTLDELTVSPTASAGIARYPDDGATVDRLWNAAAAALAVAGDGGGNSVRTPDAGVPEGALTVDVLVVDDDDALAPLLLHALSTQGYRVHRLRDGADAVEQLTAPAGIRAEVVLLDVELPGLDGLSALRRLAQHGVLDQSRVIMVTQRSGETEVLEALELGAFDHIPKPFSIPVLLHRVRRAIEAPR